MVKNCFSCMHYPNDEHCHGCGWDSKSRKNSHWEPKELDITTPKKVAGKLISIGVLEKIKAEIEQDAFKDVNGSKYIFVNRVNQIIDKYMAESGE